MIKKIGARLSAEEGFTLLELLIVLAIIGILMLIAIPAFIGFRDRAASIAVKGNLRNAATTMETRALDVGDYNGATIAELRAINPAVGADITVVSAAPTTYCLKSVTAGKTMSYSGPAGAFFNTADCT